MPGFNLGDLELIVEVGGQEVGQANEAPKGDHVDQAECPAVFLKQASHVFAESLMFAIWWLLGNYGHDDHGQDHRGSSQSIDSLPAKLGGERWRKQDGEHRAAVACTSDAHGQALVFGWEPA